MGNAAGLCVLSFFLYNGCGGFFLCMKYPKFLNEKYNTIGICAMSSGVGHKLDSFDASIEYIESNGFHIVETPSVRNNSEPSIDAKTRVDELN